MDTGDNKLSGLIDPTVTSTVRLCTPPSSPRNGPQDGDQNIYFSSLLADPQTADLKNPNAITESDLDALPRPEGNTAGRRRLQGSLSRSNSTNMLGSLTDPLLDSLSNDIDDNDDDLVSIVTPQHIGVDSIIEQQQQQQQQQKDNTTSIQSDNTNNTSLPSSLSLSTEATTTQQDDATTTTPNGDNVEALQVRNERGDALYSIRAICKAQAIARGWLARLEARKRLMLKTWNALDTKEEQELTQNHSEYAEIKESVLDEVVKLVEETTGVGSQFTSPTQGIRSLLSPTSPSSVSAGNSPQVLSPRLGGPGGRSGSSILSSLRPSSGDDDDDAITIFPPPQPQPLSPLSTPDLTPLPLEESLSLSNTNNLQAALQKIAANKNDHTTTPTSPNDDSSQLSTNSTGDDAMSDDNASIGNITNGDDDNDWSHKLEARLHQLRLLREFREHAVPYPGRQPASSTIILDHDHIVSSLPHDYDPTISPRHFGTGPSRHSQTLAAKRPARSILRPITQHKPPDLQWALTLRDELASGRLPSSSTVECLISMAYGIMCKEQNVQTCYVPLNGKVTVVGDIHGQLPDLLSILRLNGTPGGSNLYIFNGDWVDRGQQSIEVLLLIIAWKVIAPSFVYLSRGNHESADINGRDGFERECNEKYGTGMFALFSELFSTVPIATMIKSHNLVNNKPIPAIFVTHGGIPRKNLTIAEIQGENRFHTIPIPDSIIANMLWSDPTQYKGLYPSSRGAGYEFGPDVTLDFLRRNHCCMLIRSHECVDGGWELSHNNMCVTVFSASNYCGVVGNQGAYCIIESSLRPTLVTFYAVKNSILAVRASVRFNRLEQSIISKLMDRIAASRLDLIAHYQKVAHSNVEKIAQGQTVDLDTNAAIPCSKDVISRKQWADGLRTVLGLDVPFLLFQEQLGLPDRGVLGDEHGPINFMSFLSPFTPRNSFIADGLAASQTPGGKSLMGDTDYQTIIHELVQVLYSYRYELESVFRYLDLDNNQSVSRSEFVHGLYSLIIVLKQRIIRQRSLNPDDPTLSGLQYDVLCNTHWTPELLEHLADLVDANHDGEIQYQEFLQHFTYDAPEINQSSEPKGLSLVKVSLPTRTTPPSSPRPQ